MGYLFLSIALLANITKGYSGKKVSSYISGYSDAALSNFIRMVICAAVGLVLSLVQEGNFFSETSLTTLLCALLSGVATSAFIVSWIISIQRGAFVTTDIFLTLGVGLTIALSVAFLGETVKLTQIIGFLILALAAYVICSYNISIKGKMSFGSLMLLIICGASNGLADFAQKIFVKKVEGESAAAFNFYSYVFSAITLFVIYLVFKSRKKDGEKSVFSTPSAKKVIMHVAVMAVLLFVVSYFKTLAAARLDAALLYPLNQGATLILSMTLAAVCFKEKITVRSLIGISLAFIALVIINVL
ncbi:MAG: hypothetical protein E7626_00185 [Ruminococcaceae bacterium]|nr:hypothetical protein [Oscillospiraceae bacterium]